MGRPEDFGAIVATMCGEATRFVTGTGYLIDGGELRGL
jgi:3-oxoacyl-[acyl-carrier protein] reductase